MSRGYDPVREETHWTLICDGITLGLLTAAQWYTTAQQLSDPATAVRYPLMVWVMLILALGLPTYLIIDRIASFRRFRKSRARTLHLREMALTGIAPLYSPPSQEPLPITLPYTVRVHLNKVFFKGRRFKLLIEIVPIVLLVLLGFAMKIGLSTQWSFLAILLVPLLLDPTRFISMLLQESWHSPTLILDDERITAHYWGDRVTMRWDDVRCFMLINQEQTFELSDGANTIRWVDISAKTNHPYVPAMDPTQYAALMQTLPRWICTRTGLSLYDLRYDSRSQQEESASNAPLEISQENTSILAERDSSSADQDEHDHEQLKNEIAPLPIRRNTIMSNRKTLWLWVGAILGLIALVFLGFIIDTYLGYTALVFWQSILSLILVVFNACMLLFPLCFILFTQGYKGVKSNGPYITFLMIILVMLIVTFFVLPTWLIQYVAAWLCGSKTLPVIWEALKARRTAISRERQDASL